MEVEIDPRKSVHENAAAYYEKSKKMKEKLKRLKEQIEITKKLVESEEKKVPKILDQTLRHQGVHLFLRPQPGLFSPPPPLCAPGRRARCWLKK